MLILQAGILRAQSPVIEWQKTFGNINGDYAHSIKSTTDGGYIVAGYTEGTDGGDVVGYHGNMAIDDYWVVKLNNKGDIQWQRCIGGLYMETAAFISQTPDGGYIVAGSSASINCDITGNHGGLDYWIVKLRENGDIEWQKTFGGSKNEYAWALDLTTDGGYIIAGHSESTDGDVTGNHGDIDYWVVKINGTGTLVWQKSLGGSGSDGAFSVKTTNDGGCIVAGRTESNNGDVTGNHGYTDYWVVKLGGSGNLQWQKCYGGSSVDEAWSVQSTKDGGYIVAGSTTSNNGDVSGNHQVFGQFRDYWVIKLGNTGNLQWQKCYGGNKNEWAVDIKCTDDGGYVVAGYGESDDGDATCNIGSEDMWVLKINITGIIEWQKSMGGEYFDNAYSIEPLQDGSFIVAGFTCSKNIPGYHPHSTWEGTCADFWVIKLSAPVSAIPNPVITINTALTNICTGVEATLTTSVRYPGISPDYRWERNGINVGTNNPVYTASDFKDNDIVTCYVTTGGDCGGSFSQASNSVVIKVNNNIIQPKITITADNTFVCNCTPVTFKASVSNGGPSPVYQWLVNGVNTGMGGDVYTSKLLNQGDIITCVYSDKLSCIANGSVVSNPIEMMAGTSQSVSVNITSSAATFCAGSEATFTAAPINAGINPVYQWKINGINAGSNNKSFISSALANGDKVSCTVTPDQVFSCVPGNSVTSNDIIVIVTDRIDPSLTIAAATNTICAGSPATFTATPLNAGTNPSFLWKINGINEGTGSNIFSLSGLNNGDIVSCSITADPLFTCVNTTTANSNEVVMNVLNQVAPIITITASDNNACPGVNITFTATTENAGTSPSYQWMLNNVNQNGNSAFYNSSSLLNGDKLYCIVTPGTGACSSSPVSSNVIIAVIDPIPGITITPVDTIIAPGNQVRLNAVVTGNMVAYQWSPADKLENPLSITPSTIRLTGNTTYTLTAENDKGCKATETVTVKIFMNLYMPTAFTPNKDGKNDLFRIPPDVSLQLKEFSIYNRWGHKVFTTRDITKGWDGTINQKEVDAGAYVYIIKGSDDKGSVFLKGSVVLIR